MCSLRPSADPGGQTAKPDVSPEGAIQMHTHEPNRLAALSRPLTLLTAVLTGLLAGGMVLIQVVLLPFWRTVPPADFRRWFSAHSGRIRTLMVPLGAGAGVAALGSAATRAAAARGSDPASLTAAAATAGVIAITVAVNEPADRKSTR